MRTFLGRLLEPDFIERAHFITFFFSSVHLMLHSPLWTWPSISLWHIIIVVQLLSDVWLCNPVNCGIPGFPVLHYMSRSLLKLMSIESVMPSNHVILHRLLLLLPSVFPSIRVFLSELTLHMRWSKWEASASASVLPMSIQGWFPLELTGLISLQSNRLSGVFSRTTIWNQFFGA